MQFCADLAAFFSKAKESGKADVIVCLAQHLKKPKGAKPGQVRPRPPGRCSGRAVPRLLRHCGRARELCCHGFCPHPLLPSLLAFPLRTQILVTKELRNIVARPMMSAAATEGAKG